MIAAIELAMIERLVLVGKALGIRWGTVTSYPDDWDSFLQANANVSFPAAWVVFSGWNRTELLGDDVLTVRDASFAVVVAYENRRPDAQAQRHGGPDPEREPGSYRLIQAALAALAGQTFGILTRPLTPGPGRHAARSTEDVKRGVSRYSILFTGDFTQEIVPDDEEDIGALRALHVNWDIPPFAPIAALPADDDADASDHVVLEHDETLSNGDE